MESQKSQAKLTRTQSSLLRSSPTVRSSTRSMSSIAEDEFGKDLEDQSRESLLKDEKKTKLPPKKTYSMLPRIILVRFKPFFVIVSISFFTLFSFIFFFGFYLQREEIPTSENLLLALIFFAVTLFLASKNKALINQGIVCFKERLHFSKPNSKPVEWFIGETQCNRNANRETERVLLVVREGVEFYNNGDFYEGEFHKGKCNGSGVYNYSLNGSYEGDWVEGRYDGYGVESWSRGSRYRGQYRQGLRHGFGVYRFYTGDSYAGEWCNGQSHGVGVQTCADGSYYVGEFKSGVKHGLGYYHFRNGDKYAGEYFGDKMHGFGVYHFANGHCYEGSWHEGRKQGYGVYTFRSGDTRCGEWDSGNLKTPLPQLTDVVIRAVQAARKKAADSVHLRMVDEQVKKAVLAANRAATAARVAAVRAVQNRTDSKFCDTNVQDISFV
ncbi:Detected protein of confused Function [Hibiscus syriacus]|uniref:Detected protein of confused Function n=1 Tax=Hibiscus syriacus TaxID=106335 RepID=A0A6A3C5V0_HIBSY|nr:MORN repeat-containing protein 1-like [Hibiscus syriacus]KAE8724186.1 Detected protein of confused Function [Hibiscus syriacus]